jgi:serine/threonine protein kinase
MVCSGLIDIKPANILIEYDDVEAAVQSHLQQHAGPPDGLPHQMLSEAITATDASAASIKIRIVDFGVGKSGSLCTLRARSTSGAENQLSNAIWVACWVDRHLTEHITPIALRAPEVVLGIPWDAKVDVWSAACVVCFPTYIQSH